MCESPEAVVWLEQTDQAESSGNEVRAFTLQLNQKKSTRSLLANS